MYLSAGNCEKGVIDGETGWEWKGDEIVHLKNIGGTLVFTNKDDLLTNTNLKGYRIGSFKDKTIKLVNCTIVDSKTIFTKKPRIYKNYPKKSLKYRVISHCVLENCEFDCDVVLFHCKIVKDDKVISGTDDR